MAFTVLPAGFVFIAFLLHVQAQHGGMGGGGGKPHTVTTTPPQKHRLICPVLLPPAECPEEEENFCKDDSSCPSGLKCCFTGCELDCVEPVAVTTPTPQKRQHICPVFPLPEECPDEDKNFCEDDSSCPSGLKCCRTGCELECVEPVAVTTPPPQKRICPVFEKPAECPEEVEILCTNDSSCPSGLKCCNRGCKFDCVAPVAVTTPPPQKRQPGCPVFPQPAECPEEVYNFCTDDSSCPSGLKCCFTGCHDLDCVAPVGVPTTPPQKITRPSDSKGRRMRGKVRWGPR